MNAESKFHKAVAEFPPKCSSGCPLSAPFSPTAEQAVAVDSCPIGVYDGICCHLFWPDFWPSSCSSSWRFHCCCHWGRKGVFCNLEHQHQIRPKFWNLKLSDARFSGSTQNCLALVNLGSGVAEIQVGMRLAESEQSGRRNGCRGQSGSGIG